MRIMFCNIRVGKVKSERGFTLLELILVMVVMGILSSSLVLPFLAGLKQSTRPEIYATATYLAEEEIEIKRGIGYTNATFVDVPISVTIPSGSGRTYTGQVVTKYVDHNSSTFAFDDAASPPSEFIKVTVTVSNTDIPNDVVLWTILTKDFYDPNP